MSVSTEPAVGRANINGTQFYYEMAGQGDVLVLVHAGIADHRMWDDQVTAFTEHFRTIRYDMRGFGQTPMVAGAFSHRRDLYDLLRFLEVPRAHFVGCSLGGATIVDLALEHPEMIRSLTLVGTPPSGFPILDQRPPQWEEIENAFEQGDFTRAAELEVEIWIDGPHRTANVVAPEIRNRVRDMNRIALVNEALELGDEQPLKPAGIDRLAEIDAPALIITGALDVATIVRAGDLLATNIAGAQKVVMANTAHLPNMEQPEKFNRIVLEFLLQRHV